MIREEFQPSTKQQALTRQRNKCASCGIQISHLGEAGQGTHKYGEGARAHHMQHCQQQGSNSVQNCVILCQSCHYSVHEGGNFNNNSAYLLSQPSDYKYFYG